MAAMAKNDDDVPVNIPTNRARGGVTGHHVRYVLAFGLAGIIIAFIVLGLRFGLGSKPQVPPDERNSTPATQENPAKE
jgi:hypothetical protein